MSTKPSVEVLKAVLVQFDKVPTMLCRAAYDACVRGRITPEERRQAARYFQSLLDGQFTLEHWLMVRGIIPKREWRQTSKATMAHRRAWLVKMINGEIP